MFKDTLKHRCIIFRQKTADDIDLSGSTEGQVEEQWKIVATNVRSLFEWEDTPYTRGPVGIQDIGHHKVYLLAECDVKNGDRIYRALGEDGPEFFSVRRVKIPRDMFGAILHKEADLDHEPWALPFYDIS